MNNVNHVRLGRWKVWVQQELEKYSIPPGKSLTHTIDGVCPSSTPYVSRRLIVEYACWTCGPGIYALLGAQFITDKTDSLTIQVTFPRNTTLDDYSEREMNMYLDHVADWLIVYSMARAEQLTRLGSGILQIDRIRVHPVDSNVHSFEKAITGLIYLIPCDLTTDPETTVKRTLSGDLLMTFDIPVATPSLIAALNHDRPGVQRRALRILETFDTPETRQAIQRYKQG